MGSQSGAAKRRSSRASGSFSVRELRWITEVIRAGLRGGDVSCLMAADECQRIARQVAGMLVRAERGAAEVEAWCLATNRKKSTAHHHSAKWREARERGQQVREYYSALLASGVPFMEAREMAATKYKLSRSNVKSLVRCRRWPSGERQAFEATAEAAE